MNKYGWIIGCLLAIACGGDGPGHDKWVEDPPPPEIVGPHWNGWVDVRWMGMSPGARESYEWAMDRIERAAGCRVFRGVDRWTTEYNGNYLNLECGEESGKGRAFWRVEDNIIDWGRATIDCCIADHRNKVALHELMHTLGFFVNVHNPEERCDIMSGAVWNCGKITKLQAWQLNNRYCIGVK